MYNIAVIGCGVAGITSALQLQNDIKNSKITIFTTDISPNTTGDISAGLWTPYLLENNSEDDILKWSKATHDFFVKLWKKGLAKQTGLCLQPVLTLHAKENIKIPKWTEIPFGFHMLPIDKVHKINQLLGRNYSAANHYVSFTCEPTKLLPYLMKVFLKNGGNIIKKKINNFEELSAYDSIVNCAGLESRKLTFDNSLHAVRGQICRVRAPWIFQVIFDDCDDGSYIIPNCNYVILGGTHQENDENLLVDLKDKKHILEGCIRMYPGLKTCVKHIDGVGLRPGRDKVRLDVQKLVVQDKIINIINNYGHGGAGFTLCVGCAQDVSVLVRKTLKLPYLPSHL